MRFTDTAQPTLLSLLMPPPSYSARVFCAPRLRFPENTHLATHSSGGFHLPSNLQSPPSSCKARYLRSNLPGLFPRVIPPMRKVIEGRTWIMHMYRFPHFAFLIGSFVVGLPEDRTHYAKSSMFQLCIRTDIGAG